MTRTLITIIAFFQITLGFAQINNSSFDLKAKIVDEITKEMLPFASVFNQQQKFGTASNLDGYFELPDNQLGDSIVVSYIGYENKVIVISRELPRVIEMKPRSAFLNEVTVIAQSDYLYDMVANIRKNRKTKSKTSKTYFFLESSVDNQPIEIIETYFNGEYSNFGIDDLSIKKGRIGLKSFNNRSFRSTESSRLFSMHDIFGKSKLFPGSPLAFNKRKLKKDFTLDLNRSYVENDLKIFVIDFKPKNGRTDLFEGTVWIDQKNNRLLKLILKVESAAVHPFLPIGYNTIQRIDMEITKTYEKVGSDPFINSIDFNYDVYYVDTMGSQIKVTTKAFTKAYDYQKPFNLPYFNFSKHYHQDYRDVSVAPYDSLFWNRTTEFRFYDRLQEIENFILENEIDGRILQPRTRRDSLHSQLQFPYISWNVNRFKMRQAPYSVIEKSAKSKPFMVDRYNLGVKLYFDINQVRDSLIYQLHTILDPVESFYHFKITDYDRAFMNMYFDLMEIQKRELEKELSQVPVPSKIVFGQLYQKHLKIFEEKSKLLFSETDRGRDFDKMKDWNDYILESLQVDNLKFFNIDETE